MNLNFRLPHISATTVPGQIAQIVSYLRETAMQLQQLPASSMTQSAQAAQPVTRGNRFQKLHCRTLTVEDRVNGICLVRAQMADTQELRLRGKITDWTGDGDVRQSFLLAGAVGEQPVCGVLCVSNRGSCTWTGTDGVTATAESGGVILVTLPGAAGDGLILQSPDPFYLI